MKKKTVSKKKNTKLLIIVPLVVIVGLCIFFAIRNKTSVPDGAIVTQYQFTTSTECIDMDDYVTINCGCDISINNKNYTFNDTINTISCNNSGEICHNLCELHIENIKNNHNYSISHKCVNAEPVQTYNDQGDLLRTEYSSQCMCMLSENGSEPIFVDVLSHNIEDMIVKPTTQEAEQACESTCQLTCDKAVKDFLNEHKDFKLPTRW